MGLKSQALQRLGTAWTKNVQEMQRMDQHPDVHPRAPDQVFHAKEEERDGTIRVDCGPAAFKLCEKAGGPPNILVSVSGWISVRASGRSDVPLCTMDFGTRVAYFRSNGREVEHIYGVHYDMDESGGGHPVFHGQLRAMAELYEPIREQFGGSGEIGDYVGKVLRNVRTATAHGFLFGVHAAVRGSFDDGEAAQGAGSRGVPARPLGVRFHAWCSAQARGVEPGVRSGVLPIDALVSLIQKEGKSCRDCF